MKCSPNVRQAMLDMWDIVGENPIFKKRFQNVGVLSLPALMALGQTGPGLKAAGLPWDLRKTQPYCGYENYEFDVPQRISPMLTTARGSVCRNATNPSALSTRCSIA